MCKTIQIDFNSVHIKNKVVPSFYTGKTHEFAWEWEQILMVWRYHWCYVNRSVPVVAVLFYFLQWEVLKTTYL